MRKKFRPFPHLFFVLAALAAGPSHATCTDPAGNEADVFYNQSYHTYQFCNGTSWLAFSGGSNCTASGSYSPTSPSRHGYFVMSGGTYNGALNDLPAADATCLTDLTTNTAWMGYSTANSNGQLVATKVHAFLCDWFSCGNLMPLTTYNFANAGNSSAGGASFTTDLNSLGPNDSANWSGSTYFGGSYTYWTGSPGNTSSAWATVAPGAIFTTNVCAASTSQWVNSSYNSGEVGLSAYTDGNRWASSAAGCSGTYNLICFVNP